MKLFTLKDRLTVYLGTLVFAAGFGGAGWLIGRAFGLEAPGAIAGVLVSIIPAQIAITRLVRKDAEERVEREDGS